MVKTKLNTLRTQFNKELAAITKQPSGSGATNCTPLSSTATEEGNSQHWVALTETAQTQCNDMEQENLFNQASKRRKKENDSGMEEVLSDIRTALVQQPEQKDDERVFLGPTSRRSAERSTTTRLGEE
ncbi:hypothetical protein CBL_12836 [Carabus blaptoides fortunei]